MTVLRTLPRDALASVVVFLVALPLCMGIAIASGMPPAKGLITGIIGGLVVGFIAGAPLQVSGPAAGLAVLVFELVRTHGMAALGPVLLLAGLIQLVAGALRLGGWFRVTAPAVVYGMLAGIAHPITGMDHLLAMLAVGLFERQRFGRALGIAIPSNAGTLLTGLAVRFGLLTGFIQALNQCFTATGGGHGLTDRAVDKGSAEHQAAQQRNTHQAPVGAARVILPQQKYNGGYPGGQGKGGKGHEAAGVNDAQTQADTGQQAINRALAAEVVQWYEGQMGPGQT